MEPRKTAQESWPSWPLAWGEERFECRGVARINREAGDCACAARGTIGGEANEVVFVAARQDEGMALLGQAADEGTSHRGAWRRG